MQKTDLIEKYFITFIRISIKFSKRVVSYCSRHISLTTICWVHSCEKPVQLETSKLLGVSYYSFKYYIDRFMPVHLDRSSYLYAVTCHAKLVRL